ncbi:MAG: mismatch repair protein MutS, partial [Oscillospiraceae bacterium]|nr:mismatch repair protein MutS [Oscillospiraceae bacterium]
MIELTPMMRQYTQLKEAYPDCLLFFRLGDFYEMFQEDAKIGAEELELTLTTRDRGKPKEEQTPMCGVPYHSAESYISRLIAKGYKVAICEQMEDPAVAKGLVERDIVRIITPGTLIDASMLDEGKNNFIMGAYLDSAGAGVCFCDISTGEVFVTSFEGRDAADHILNEAGRFSPREAVLSDGAYSSQELTEFLRDKLACRCERGQEHTFRPDAARELLGRQFMRGLDTLPQGEDAPVCAVGGLFAYLHETQKTDLSHLSTLNYYAGGQFMELDFTARRNLELCETMRTKEKRGTLLWVLDRTKTPMGGRLIRNWIERPLLSPVQISRRHGAVAELEGNSIVRQELIFCLKEISDLERLIGRIVYGTAGARDLAALSVGLGKIPTLRGLLESFCGALLPSLAGELDDLEPLRALIDRAIDDDPPFSVREGGFIRKGYHADVDMLRDLKDNGASMMAAVELREREKTGIKTLKVGYNKVFGYYIEVSKSYFDMVPQDYIRKQTLANCERYITQELKDLEHTILSAQDKLTGLEYELFCQLRETAAAQVAAIQKTAAAVAQIDVLASFATVAVEQNYCMPQVDISNRLDITEGRHPVVEKMLKNALFVPNDTHMDGKEEMIAIITGPNMAGKSTYMRQVALIVLMAQIGSFVPARAAHIGMVDRVFTRIGASDDLAAGQSTFMVEMTEVAELLKHATSRSLLILDEIGRGTSTYDGMSIARAVLEFCADQKKLGAKTLFATHYHELTVLEGEIPGVKNYNIAAKKRKDDIIFLRKIVRGGADQSYGIEVAKLAGVPNRVIERARAILEELETAGAPLPAAGNDPAEQVSLLDMGAQSVANTLRVTSVETLTPIEAMNLLYELKQRL